MKFQNSIEVGACRAYMLGTPTSVFVVPLVPCLAGATPAQSQASRLEAWHACIQAMWGEASTEK